MGAILPSKNYYNMEFEDFNSCNINLWYLHATGIGLTNELSLPITFFPSSDLER